MLSILLGETLEVVPGDPSVVSENVKLGRSDGGVASFSGLLVKGVEGDKVLGCVLEGDLLD